MKIVTTDDIRNFVDGCTLLGVGGGGNPEEGFLALKSAIEEKGPIEWINVDDVKDDALALCTFLMGSSAPPSEEKNKIKEKLGLTEIKCPINLLNAVVEWERYTGKKVDIIVPLEVGGSNMPVPIAVGKKLDKIIVDGDYAGRAIPEIFQISLMLEDIPFYPGTVVDKFGNIVILKETVNIAIAERMGKYISQVAVGSTGMAGFPINGKQLKRLLVRGSVSKAFELGKKLDEVRENKIELNIAMKKFGGTSIFKGQVVNKVAKEWEGYYTGDYILKGIDKWSGDQLKIFFRNENHIAWENDRCIASSPDIICCLESKTIKPMRNNAIETGMILEVYVFPCDNILKNEKILKYLCPRHFGFNFDYISFNQ